MNPPYYGELTATRVSDELHMFDKGNGAHATCMIIQSGSFQLVSSVLQFNVQYAIPILAADELPVIYAYI